MYDPRLFRLTHNHKSPFNKLGLFAQDSKLVNFLCMCMIIVLYVYNSMAFLC